MGTVFGRFLQQTGSSGSCANILVETMYYFNEYLGVQLHKVFVYIVKLEQRPGSQLNDIIVYHITKYL
jgi:hypothetical protein